MCPPPITEKVKLWIVNSVETLNPLLSCAFWNVLEQNVITCVVSKCSSNWYENIPFASEAIPKSPAFYLLFPIVKSALVVDAEIWASVAKCGRAGGNGSQWWAGSLIVPLCTSVPASIGSRPSLVYVETIRNGEWTVGHRSGVEGFSSRGHWCCIWRWATFSVSYAKYGVYGWLLYNAEAGRGFSS